MEEIRSVFPQLTVEQAEHALELCHGNEDDAMEELTENPRFRRKIVGKNAPRIQPRRNHPGYEAPKVPKTVDGSVFVGSFRGKTGLVQERGDVEPTNQDSNAELPFATQSKGRRDTDQGREETNHNNVPPVAPPVAGSYGTTFPDGQRKQNNTIKEGGEQGGQYRGRLKRDRSKPGLSCSSPESSKATPGTSLPQESSKKKTETKRCAGKTTNHIPKLEDALPAGGAAKPARPRRQQDSTSSSVQDQEEPNTTDNDPLLQRKNVRSRSGGPSSSTPLPKVSIRCINCQKAKRGHCGTEKAIKSCLRRGLSGAAPHAKAMEPEKATAPGKGWRTAGRKPSVAWQQHPFATLGSGRILAREFRRRRSVSKQDLPRDVKRGTKRGRAVLRETHSAPEYNGESTGTEYNEEQLNRRLPLTLGRKRQKACKNCELVQLGKLQTEEGWFNAGYIFPDGLHTRTVFRSSVMVDQLVVHDCYIVGEGGQYYPKPTFRIVAADRPEEPLEGRSCTACWTGILHRINGEINRRREAGEDLPPPPRTAIAGPEYFGLCHPEIIEMYEALDVDKKCTEYWQGKNERIEYEKTGVLVPRVRKVAQQRERRPDRRRTRTRRVDDFDVEAYFQEEYTVSRWSSLSRTERYKRRNGGLSGEDHPLPGFIDPITLEEVVNPAISPDGHVMGYATWVAVLSENAQCPFTKKPLSREHLVKLTKANFERYEDRIIYQ